MSLLGGEYEWSVLQPPALGRGLWQMVAVSEDDVWVAGTEVRHWDGSAFTSYALSGPLPRFVDTIVVRGPSDVWFAGSSIWHFDGTSVSEAATSEGGPLPPLSPPARYALFGDSSSLFLRASGSGISMYRWNGTAFASIYGPQGPGISIPSSAFATDLYVHAGQPGLIGLGTWSPANGAVTPALTSPRETLSASYGDTFYSYYPEVGSDRSFQVQTATWPGEFATTASASLDFLDVFQGEYPLPTLGVGPVTGGVLDAAPRLMVVDIDADANGATFALRYASGLAVTTFFVRAEGGTARVLTDRLIGHEVYGIARVGTAMWVLSSSGSILKGVAR